MPRLRLPALAAICLFAVAPADATRRQILRLPGPPISLLQSDLDGHDLADLVAVVA